MQKKNRIKCAKFIRRACINTSLKDLKKYYGVCFIMLQYTSFSSRGFSLQLVNALVYNFKLSSTPVPSFSYLLMFHFSRFNVFFSGMLKKFYLPGKNNTKTISYFTLP